MKEIKKATYILVATVFILVFSVSILNNTVNAQTSTSWISTLYVSPSALKVPLSNWNIDLNNGVRNVAFVNFDAKSENGDSVLNSVNASLIVSGTKPSTLYLYQDQTLISSKSIASGSSISNIVFDNLDYIVPINTSKTFTIKGDFPSNGQTGTSIMVNVDSVIYKRNNGVTVFESAQSPITGSVQNFYSGVLNFSLASSPVSNVYSDQNGRTIEMSAVFNLNITADGGNIIKPTAADFDIQFGTSSQDLHKVDSVSVVVIPNSNINDGSTASVTVTANVSSGSIPASGIYRFVVQSIKYNINGVSRIQTAGLENLKTINGANAIVANQNPTSTSCSTATFYRDLTVGYEGYDVVSLQTFLEDKGLLVLTPGSSKGYFGSQTRSALANYQISKGITPAEGYFGLITRNAVISDCGTGTPVSSLPTTLLPTASIIATLAGRNAGNDITVYAGETVLGYKWASTNAVSSSATYTTNESRCGSGGKWWSANSLNGSSIPGTFSSASAGCVYTVNYVVTSKTGNIATSTMTIRVEPKQVAPTISSISPTQGVSRATSLGGGTTVTLKGSGFNYDSVIYFGGIPLTGSGGMGSYPFVVTSNSAGTEMQFVVPIAPATVYDVFVKNKFGTSNSKKFTIVHDLMQTTPTASLTANGVNDLTVNTGVNVVYKWSSSGADQSSATYTTNESRCGSGGKWWSANSLNGSSIPGTFSSASAGCVYTVNYVVTNSFTGVTTSSQLIIRVNSPTIQNGANVQSAVSRFLKFFGW